MMTGLRIGRLIAIGSVVMICTPATFVARAPAVVVATAGAMIF